MKDLQYWVENIGEVVLTHDNETGILKSLYFDQCTDKHLGLVIKVRGEYRVVPFSYVGILTPKKKEEREINCVPDIDTSTPEGKLLVKVLRYLRLYVSRTNTDKLITEIKQTFA